MHFAEKASSIPMTQIPEGVRLIAVTKGRTPEEIETLIATGQVWFGENRLNEIQKKWPALLQKYPYIKLQFIGRLQSNKVSEVIKYCNSLISIDRKSVVDAVSSELSKNPKNIELLIQVNISGEIQKGGVSLEEFPKLLEYVQEKGLKIAGLMTMPPEGVDPAPYFRQLQQLAKQYELPELSMGMSSDYQVALQYGATQVRIGRSLFA